MATSTKFGFTAYDVIRHKNVTGIIVSISDWGCKIMLEAWDGMTPTAVEMVNYPWSAVAFNFHKVG